MFNLDPGKLIVIGVVAIILLGPDKLPQFARQVGGAWRSFNDFRHRMESEVRSSMPDLPPTSEIARLARSPSALLNHLSSMTPEEAEEAEGAPGMEDAEGVPGAEGTVGEVPDGSFQPPGLNGTGDAAPLATGVAGENGSTTEAAGDRRTDGTVEPDTAAAAPVPSFLGGDTDGTAGSDQPETPGAPATNGRSAGAPQPAEVAVPADPTLN